MTPDTPNVILVDGGTTRTRVWLVRGDEVIAEAQATVGARDTARDGSPRRLERALHALIARVRRAGEALPVPCRATIVVAAGMLTSSLGLRELEHVPAPAGVEALAARVERHKFPAVTNLPVLLVPGIRSGPLRCSREDVAAADVIRGEEAAALGLHLLGWLPAGGIVLTLGSHWKAIHVDRAGQVTSSFTSLSGELIHVVSSQTVLAGSLPREWPAQLDPDWVDAGVHEAQRSGLGRTLFCVRLLEQRVASTPDQRLAYLMGAAIGGAMDTLQARRTFRPGTRVLVIGHPGLAHAFAEQLRGTSVDALPLTDAQVGQAVRAGLLRTLACSTFAAAAARPPRAARRLATAVTTTPTTKPKTINAAKTGPTPGTRAQEHRA